ncbi:PglZ domain-containing protein [Polaribacter litorisediminis]|uniref:PglZ domain-containing protein n=1 Tax=Polaribacter litorisediminis TaxID=1908341 RepID=UPI001CBB39DC|nr:PglZ domain-containing protein [Polaribacter litorisediminis]UAM97945.1 PglZ domain-containing protein [Polaribacter litorisediminis]
MGWKQRIITVLNLIDKSPKIISDVTGVLFSQEFKNYVSKEKIQVVYSEASSKMLAAANGNQLIIFITSKKTVPQFLKSYFEHKTFEHSQLPINGDVSILKSYDAKTIVAICNYIFANNAHIVLSKLNSSALLEKAIIFNKLKVLKNIKIALNKLLIEEKNIENVINIAENWGTLIYESYKQNDDSFLENISKIDETIKEFIDNKTFEQIAFASTASKPLSIDKIIHHIKSKKENKVALLCFDCMGIAEWNVLKEYLIDLNISYKEQYVFTLLPSVTSICRTAIFHGSTDVYDIKYPGRKDEAKAFASFFKDKQTKYFVEDDIINEDTLLGYDTVSVLYNFFDDLCHSSLFPANENTKAIYFNNCKQYLEKSNVKQTIKTLLDNNFSIHFCSDHGSVIAKGNGERLQKYLIDDFAKRAVIIPEEASGLTQLEKIDIPFVKHKKLVLPEGRTMFTQKDKIEINHGGISLEEIVVPFITVIK